MNFCIVNSTFSMYYFGLDLDPATTKKGNPVIIHKYLVFLCIYNYNNTGVM